jgi:hypothetical protein
MRPYSAPALAAVAACVALCANAPALAQTTIISLPHQGSFTAGPLARDYPDDSQDLWVVEDFATDRAWLLADFSVYGNGFGTPTDVVAVIYDGMPPNGAEVLRSVPGTGTDFDSGSWATYRTSFGGQRLPAGSYYIAWTVQGGTDLLPVMFVQSGPYAVGSGTPNTAWHWNPGGGRGWPQGEIRPVLDGLNQTGNPTGVNILIRGAEAPPTCGTSDFNGDTDFGTDQDIEAFFACLAGVCCSTCFSGGADFNGDGDTGTDQDIEAFFRVLAGGTC